MLNIGVVGYGYWGPNIVRNFHSAKQSQVTAVCDRNPETFHRLARFDRSIKTTTNYQDITRDPTIDCVAIVTPLAWHYEIAKDALLHDKHVFVEKPFVTTMQEAEELAELAMQKKRVVMVDHTFIFTPAARAIKNHLPSMGPIYYYDSTRVNLGLFQSEINVVWDLAPHDFSLLEFFFNQKPRSVSTHGIDQFGSGLEHTAYVTIYFDSMIAHLNLNWLSPVKIRQTLISGKERMIVWDDVTPDEKLKIYDKGVTMQPQEGREQKLISYRLGDMFCPKLDHSEALADEINYFNDCVIQQTEPINNSHSGWQTVKLLEACDRSIKSRGQVVSI